MGKKYNPYRFSPGSGLFKDSENAFEILGASIVTYRARTEGWLWWQKTVYEHLSTSEITPEMQVRVWAKEGASGNVEVKGALSKTDYPIFGDVEAFAREVEQAINGLS